jgi:hypothetical protein
MSLKTPPNSNVGSNNGRNNNNNNNNNSSLPLLQYDVKTLYHEINKQPQPEKIADDIFKIINSFFYDGYHFINSTQVIVPGMNYILTTLYFVYNNVPNNNNKYNNNMRESAMQQYEKNQLGNPESKRGGAKPKAKKEPKESKSKKTKIEKCK